MLGVPRDLIDREGAVSEALAIARPKAPWAGLKPNVLTLPFCRVFG